MKKATKKVKKVVLKKNASVYTHTTNEVIEYIKEVTTDFDRKITAHIGVVSEDFQHRVSAIAEQFHGLNKKLDEHGKKLDEHGKKLDEHGKKLDGHGGVLASHSEMIGRIMIDIEEIKVGMREKVGRDEFNKLETRLVSLESFVFSGRNKVPKTSKAQKIDS